MQLESNSLRLIGITRAKGKVREFGVPEEHHIAIPDGDEPDALLLTGVGILGDAAARLLNSSINSIPVEEIAQLELSARYFDAFLESKLPGGVDRDIGLLGSAAYFLAGRPGSSAVMARRTEVAESSSDLDSMLEWVLNGMPSTPSPAFVGTDTRELLSVAVDGLREHFSSGGLETVAVDALSALRGRIYEKGTSRDVLLIDLVGAVTRFRLAASVWNTLPALSGLPVAEWTSAFSKAHFPKELWPAQLMVGQAGIFLGASGAILMPTSAGKTRSVEIILRSSILSQRSKLAVVVAPFRALAHEIGTSLRAAFRGEAIRINELSDAMQLDFEDLLQELLGAVAAPRPLVLILTPEKLQYVLRQVPTLASEIGLLVYDECHQFDSGGRGVTYELLLTEIARSTAETCQTVLISAVMSNARRVAEWAIGVNAVVVDGSTLTPTARAIAFASWTSRLGRLEFFDYTVEDRPDYFVPRAIEAVALSLRPRERKARVFPRKGDESWKDVSLYLGLKLAASGTVAVFCGRKDTANGMASILADAYERGLPIGSPAEYSDALEVEKIHKLTEAHYGSESPRTVAARLGVFLHHGTTTQGLRLAIEHAMQTEQIRFVVCTSTLAQGVNLPIRYLIISGTRQAGDDIKVRDFQNLLGRAGRAGMHTEGLVIFANPALYDQRRARADVFATATGLLSKVNIEDMGSSLLEIISAIRVPSTSTVMYVEPVEMIDVLMAGPDTWREWAAGAATQIRRVTPAALLQVIARRRQELTVVESHLMAMRGDSAEMSFRDHAKELARRTLAYTLASSVQQTALESLFERIADHLDDVEPLPERQSLFARTLMGASEAKQVFEWTESRRESLAALESPESWLEAAWPLLSRLAKSGLLAHAEPAGALYQVAQAWIAGDSYASLAGLAAELGVTKPRGSRRVKVSVEDVFGFCDQTLSFEFSLITAAIALSLEDDDSESSVAAFQKTLKYGLPDSLSISTYEAGLADRILARRVSAALAEVEYDGTTFEEAWASPLRSVIREVVDGAPSYFASTLASRA